MSYSRHYRRRRSTAGQIVGDTSYVANRLPWEWAVILGIALFIFFYWAVPAWVYQHLESLQGNAYRPLLESLFARRVHWSQWLGIALGLVCAFFAVRNYFLMDQLDRSGECGVSFFSRIIARFFT